MTTNPNNRPPLRHAFPAAPADALASAARLDRRADLLLAEGRHELAERLAHVAHATRERVREARA